MGATNIAAPILLSGPRSGTFPLHSSANKRQDFPFVLFASESHRLLEHIPFHPPEGLSRFYWLNDTHRFTSQHEILIFLYFQNSLFPLHRTNTARQSP
jgi:hypothetical protein